MKKLLRFTILAMLVTVLVLGGFAGTAHATGGGNPHKDEGPQKQSLIKKDSGRAEDKANGETKEESSLKPAENEPEDEYLVELFIEPDPPIKGHGELILEIKDDDSEAVTDATVKVTISMDPQMDGHGTMDYEPQEVVLEFAEEAGHYIGEVKLTEVGEIKADINIEYSDGHKETLNTTFEVIYNGPNLIFLWSIFGIIVICIIIAQVLKGKKQQPKGGEANVGAK